MGELARARIELLLEEGDAVNPHVNPFIHANEPRLVRGVQESSSGAPQNQHCNHYNVYS